MAHSWRMLVPASERPSPSQAAHNAATPAQNAILVASWPCGKEAVNHHLTAPEPSNRVPVNAASDEPSRPRAAQPQVTGLAGARTARIVVGVGVSRGRASARA